MTPKTSPQFALQELSVLVLFPRNQATLLVSLIESKEQIVLRK